MGPWTMKEFLVKQGSWMVSAENIATYLGDEFVSMRVNRGHYRIKTFDAGDAVLYKFWKFHFI